MTVVSETGAIGLLYAEVFAFMLETFALVLYLLLFERIQEQVRALVVRGIDSIRHNHVRHFHHDAERVDEYARRFQHQCVPSNRYSNGNKSVGAIPNKLWAT